MVPSSPSPLHISTLYGITAANKTDASRQQSAWSHLQLCIRQRGHFPLPAADVSTPVLLTLCVWSVLSPNIFLLWLLELSSALAQETMKDVTNENINHFLIKCQNKFPCLHREYIFVCFFSIIFLCCVDLCFTCYTKHKTLKTGEKEHN